MPNYALSKKIYSLKHLTSVSVVLLILAVLINLVSTNILSTQGISVNVSQTETIRIEKENQILSVKIEEESRLKEVEKLAQEKGFVRSGNIVFAPTNSTVALR